MPKINTLTAVPTGLTSCFLILLIFTCTLRAQTAGTLRGFIRNAANGEALPNATVFIGEVSQGAAADINGYFIIPALASNRSYDVKVSYVGYATQVVKVKILPGKTAQLKIELIPSELRVGQVEVSGERSGMPASITGFQRISAKEIQSLPHSVEADIMRTLQYMPGVKTTADVNAQYYVRGGGSDQNLVLLNGATVYNPFHAMGLFSAIDPEMLNAMEFFKGGFGADYGGRLSSVMNLATRDGNKNRMSGTANFGFLTGKVLLEGPIPNGSFIVTGRKSLFNNTLNKFIKFQDSPYGFYDISYKANYTGSDEKLYTKVSVFGFNSRDKLDQRTLEEAFQWENNIYGLNWVQAWESPLFSELSISSSGFSGQVDPNESNALRRKNRVRDLTLKMDFTYMYQSRDELKVGYWMKYLNTNIDYEWPNRTSMQYEDYGANIGAFVKYKLQRFGNFSADIGTRVLVASLSKGTKLFEPRVSLLWKIHPLFSLKASWGIYSQDLITLTNENDVISLFEPWITVPDYLSAPNASHYIIGAESYLNEYLSLSVEGYYKKMKNLTEYNKNKFFPSDPDLVNGEGESYGWEFLLKFKTTDIDASCSYSLSWAYKEIDGWLYHPRYDYRHSLNLNLIWNMGHNWEAGAVWTLNSGLPFTQIESFYDKYYPDNLSDRNDVLYSYNSYAILADKNAGRLPYYHRLDLNLSRKISLDIVKMYFSLNLINVYNRKNIFYFERETGRQVNMLPFLPSASLKLEI